MTWVDRSLREIPRWAVALTLKTALCAHLGRTEEAREWLQRRIEFQPDLTIKKWKALAREAFASPELFAWFADGLRKAGLPEE